MSRPTAPPATCSDTRRPSRCNPDCSAAAGAGECCDRRRRHHRQRARHRSDAPCAARAVARGSGCDRACAVGRARVLVRRAARGDLAQRHARHGAHARVASADAQPFSRRRRRGLRQRSHATARRSGSQLHRGRCDGRARATDWPGGAQRGAGRCARGVDRSFTGLPTAGPGATVKSVADQLASSAEKVAWHHETGDATVLAEFRRRVEGITSAPLVVPPLVIGTPVSRMSRAAPPPAPAPASRGQRAKPPVAEALPPERAERSLLTELSVQSGSGEWTPTGNRMTAGAICALDTFIGLPREGVVAPSQPIPEKSLPPSATGHHLSIAFTPLWRGPDNAFPAAQTKGLDLPRTGDSPHVTFYFTAPAALPDFRARLVVLFGFRVLQTLILDAPAGALRLEVENRVSNDFGERSEAPPFEAALIVNDNPRASPASRRSAPTARLHRAEGLDVLVASIRKQLKVLNLDDEAPALDDEAVESLLRTLAALRGRPRAEIEEPAADVGSARRAAAAGRRRAPRRVPARRILLRRARPRYPGRSAARTRSPRSKTSTCTRSARTTVMRTSSAPPRSGGSRAASSGSRSRAAASPCSVSRSRARTRCGRSRRHCSPRARKCAPKTSIPRPASRPS